MPKNFDGTYTTTQVLTNPTTDNPATVTSTGLIEVNSTVANAAAIFGSSGVAWTLSNLGTVESIGSSGVAINLRSGGFVTNGAGGTNAGYVNATATGINLGAGGTITNLGTIGTSSAGNVTAVNIGAGGGTLVNGATDAIGTTITASQTGVSIGGTAGGVGLVFNYGTIQSTTTNGPVISLPSGGTAINLDPNQSVVGDIFRLSPDSSGGTLVTDTAPGATLWTNSAGGSWTVDANWSAGVPTSSVDATLGALASYYTVTLTATGAANSLTLDDYTAALIISTPNGSPSANLAVQGNLNNAGRLYVDGYYGNTGGSFLTIGGTLTNSSYIYIGTASLSGPTMVTAAALANTGTIYLDGGTGTNTNQATLDITGAAPSVLSGTLDLGGHALVEFGGGSFASIADNSSLYLHGADAFVADAGNTGTNSALTGLASNAGILELDGGAQVQTQGNFSNSGQVFVDYYYYSTIGGSSLTVGGTLTNTGDLYIGNSYQTTAGSTVTAAGLALTNTSHIYLYGGTGANTNQAILDIAGAAPSVLNGRLELSGHALVEFGGGGITGIADNSSLYLHGANAFVADAGNTGSNSALSGLASNAGILELDGGAQVQTLGDFHNSDTVYVDYTYSTIGGSSLIIGGMLTNTGGLYIGNSNASAPTTISAAGLALTNTSYIYLYGGTGTNTNQTTLDIAGAAPSLLTGRLELSGHALAEFGGGGITGIADNSSLFLHGTNAFVADAGNTGSNSALSGLASNAGTLELDGGAQIQTQGNFSNTGTIYVDYYYYSQIGGSSLTIGGTLANAGTLYIGSTNQSAAGSTVSATGLTDTGTIYLYGGTGTSTNQATLDVTSGTAPSVLIGDLNLQGHALVEFGSGQITSIGRNGSIILGGASAFIATATDTGSNSALSGLESNAGRLDLDGGATVQTTGDFANFGYVTVNSYNYGIGGSTLAVGGMLTNTGSLNIGSYYQIASTTVSAAGFLNTGYVYLYGGGGTNTNQSTLDIASAAPTVLTGYFYLSGHALAEFASGSITEIARNATLTVNGGNAFVADAGSTDSNSALTGLANNAGTLDLENGAIIQTQGDFTNFGSLQLDYSYDGGSTLTIGGTLTNTGNLYIGNYYGSATTTLTASGLANDGYIQIYGGTGTNPRLATFDITGLATATGRITLYGNAVLNAGALSVVNGGTITVSAGATTSGVIVSAGGTEIVSSGGTSFAPTIAGGIFELAAGAMVTGGGISFVGSGGVLQVDGSAMPTNPISGFGLGDTIDLRTVAFGSTTTAVYDSTSGTLTVTNGGVTETLTLAGIAAGTLFTVAGDGHGGTFVTEAPTSGSTKWTNAAGGNWTNSDSWSGGVPQSTVDATIGVAGSYTVSLTTSGAANSLTLDHAGATLNILTTSAAAASATLAIQGDLKNGGGVYVDTGNSPGGSTLSIGGALNTTNHLELGNGAPIAVTTVSADSVLNSGRIYLGGGSLGGPTLITADDFTNTQYVYVDAFAGQGGSTLSVGGTLANTNNLYIGNATLAASTIVTASALAHTGDIYLYGGTGKNTNQAILDITSGPAPSVLTGSFHLSGHTLLEFQTGSIGSIANTAYLTLTGADAFVANSGNIASNSALSGLTSNDGTLEFNNGAQVQIQGDFVNNYYLNVDPQYYTSGGSSLTIGGTLTNTGNLAIGNNYQAGAGTTVSVAELVNTGTITLNQYNGTITNQATLNITSQAAPSVLTGNLNLFGHALVEFGGGGSIISIASDGRLFLSGPNAFVAVAGDVASNSALTGLRYNAGSLTLDSGAALAIDGDFVNNNFLNVDYNNSTIAGSNLTIDGTLTNTYSLIIGSSYYHSGATIVSAAALANTGSITLNGGTGASTYQAVLDFTSQTAPTTLTGGYYLSGRTLVEFADGQITDIGDNAVLNLNGANAFIADAADPGSNSALLDLANNAGYLVLENGASIHTRGNLSNGGTIYVGYSYTTGGSSLTVGGTLSNTGTVNIGNASQTAPGSTVSADGLANAGYVNLYGGTGTNTNRATLDITSGMAPSVLSGHLSLAGTALVVFGGGQITSIAQGGGITLNGVSAFVADASDTNSNSALLGLASNAGTLQLDNGAALQTLGDFSNSGALRLSTYYYDNGSTISIAGTLSNTGDVVIGSGNPTASGNTVSASSLVNTGHVYLYGGTGSSTNRATLDITSGTAPSVLSGDLFLSGHALASFSGGQITDIAATGGLTLIGGTAFVADASNTSGHSALNLARNAGSLDLEGGVTLSTPGDFTNTGTLSVDAAYYYNGGSTLSIGGALTNTNYVNIGNYYGSGTTTVSATGLFNTGTLYLTGNYNTSTTQTILDIDGAAIDGGTIVLNGHALLNADSLTITSGGRLYISSGSTAAGAIVGSGGLEYVHSGGVSTSATISGGTLELAGGTVAAATIAFTARGGKLQIDGKAMPTNTITGFGSHQTIDLRGISGGSSGTANITSGNTLVVNQGGTDYTLQLDPNRNYSNATVNLAGDGFGGTAVTLTIPPLIVSSGQSVTISAGEIEDDIQVLNGGTLIVLSGGTANNAIDAGNEILSGGLDFNGMITSGGTMLVSAGGLASITHVAALGQLTVLAGGSASDATVASGGALFVSSGGSEIGGVISGGGFETVFSGGLASDTTIAGGTLELADGGAASGTIGFSGVGGVLQIDGSSAPWSATIIGFGRGDAIDLRSLLPSAGNAVTFDPSTGDLTVSGGGASYVLTLGGVAAGTAFGLADDTHGGTLVREVPEAPSGLALSPGSDSGAVGDGLTNVTTPVITGVGEVGDTVALFDGSTPVGSGTVGSGGTWAVATSPLPDGVHALTAMQSDAFGGASEASSALSLTLDTTPPAVTAGLVSDTGSSGSDRVTANPGLSGTGDPGGLVTVSEGGTVLGSAAVGSGGVWSFAPVLADGFHTLSASQTDAAGNTGSATLAFTLDTTPPPAPTGSLAHDTGASASDGVTSDPALIGSASPNATVTISDGGSALGSVTTDGGGVWGFTPTLADGGHNLIASETDAAGNTGSALVSFTLDTTAPVVGAGLVSDTGSSASDGVTANPGLSGTAEPGGVVTVSEGGTVLGSATVDSGGVWSFAPVLLDGGHTLSVSQTDAAGNTGSVLVAFTLDTTAPAVTAALASDTGSSGSDGVTANPGLSGTGEPGGVVTVSEGGTVLGSAAVGSGGVWSFAPVLADGGHTLSVSETDAAGNTGSAVVSFTLDTTAPAVTAGLVSDTGSSASDGVTSSPGLSGTAEPGGVVTVSEGGTVLGSVTTDSSGVWSFAPVLADGGHTLRVSQTDAAGNTGSVLVSFTLDTTAPVVGAGLVNDTGGSASDGVTANPGLSGTGEPGGVVTISEGGTVLGSAAVDSGGVWSFAPVLADGGHTLSASQTDAAGNTGSVLVAFTLDTAAPVVGAGLASDTGSSASDGVTANPGLGGTAEPGGVVTISEGGTVLGSATVGSGGVWSFAPVLADGGHTLSASQTDAAGNTGSAVVSFTLDTTAPAVTAGLANDTGGSASDGVTSNPGLTGTGEPNRAVTVSEGGTVLGSAIADAGGVWNFTPVLANGGHTVSASQTDAAGNTGTATLAFTLVGASTVEPGETRVLSAGESVSGLTVLGGGILIVGSGASALDTLIASAGLVSVGSGGVTSSTDILSGGVERVDPGGLDLGATISGGGFEDVFGSAGGAVIFGGGSQTVEAGGTAENTLLDDAAVQRVFGFAGGTVVSATDLQIVESGGVASGTVVSSGGGEIVHSGGLTIDTTIAGGFVELADGAAASGTTTFIDFGLAAGGVLRILGSNMPASPIAGFTRGDTIDLVGLGFSAANSVSFDAGSGALNVSGGVVETLSLVGVAPGTAFALVDDGSGGTAVREVPPAPAGLALFASSDSGAIGDNLTNVTTPFIVGTGEALDTVRLFDGGSEIQSTIVAPSGGWNLVPLLAAGVHVLTATVTDGGGNVSGPSAPLVLTIDTAAPLTVPASPAAFAADGGAQPIGIVAPSDDLAGLASITVRELPDNGSVTLADGATAVTAGQVLSVAQLTGLKFTPAPNRIGSSSSLTYTVTDRAGNASVGSATLGVAVPAVASLFDFVFTYNDPSRDYFYGTVSDNGLFGYQIGQQITTTAGRYDIFNQEGLPATTPAGTVFVTNYSHGGPGQASTTPVNTAAGQPSGTGGLLSVSDAVRGTDGQRHEFSSTLEASFGGATALFGFVYTYAGGAAFYSGTVTDDGSFGPPGGTEPISRTVSDDLGHVLGSYSIFGNGVTTRAPGSVVIDRFTIGDASFVANHAGPGAVDGTGGLGSEIGRITVNGTIFGFSADHDPGLTLSVQTVPADPLPNPADAIGRQIGEVYRQVLGRNPDSEGLATYSAALAGGTSLASIRTTIARSGEAQSLLNGLYHQIFGRDADAGGLATYTGQLINGSSLAAVQLILAQSSEAQGDIEAIYQEVLGRPADGGGLTTYMAALAGGTSLGEDGVRGSIAHSPEAASDLTQLFQTILGRAPAAAELSGMADLLAASATRQSLADLLQAGGSDSISTAGGFTTITAQPGDDTLSALPQTPTLFVFADIAFGNDTIVGFDPARDTIQLPHTIVADLAALTSHTTPLGAGTLITLGDRSITLANTNPNTLTQPNFLFL